MSPKGGEALMARNGRPCGPEQSGEAIISVRTLNSPCGGTRKRKKVGMSGTIMAEMTHGANVQGSSREASSVAPEAPCMTHDGAGVLESYKKNNSE